jgi:hypothetical protein
VSAPHFRAGRLTGFPWLGYAHRRPESRQKVPDQKLTRVHREDVTV